MDNDNFLCWPFHNDWRVAIHGSDRHYSDGISNTISRATPENRLMVAVLLLLWVSGIASAFIDNIPYTATMVPVVIELASDPNLGFHWARWLGH